MLIVYFILTGLMITVALSDIARYRIPNALVLALILVYPVAVYLAHPRPDWMSACVVFILTFVVGLLLLARYMGGGDVKLLTAATLYVGKPEILDFIVYVALLGGVGTILLIMLRIMTPYLFIKLGKPADAIPRVLTHKEPVPYGVAIAGAFLILLWANKLPGLAL